MAYFHALILVLAVDRQPVPSRRSANKHPKIASARSATLTLTEEFAFTWRNL